MSSFDLPPTPLQVSLKNHFKYATQTASQHKLDLKHFKTFKMYSIISTRINQAHDKNILSLKDSLSFGWSLIFQKCKFEIIINSSLIILFIGPLAWGFVLWNLACDVSESFTKKINWFFCQTWHKRIWII